MRILFCSDPLAPRAVDMAYRAEAAATAARFAHHLMRYEQLVQQQDASAVLRRRDRATGAAA